MTNQKTLHCVITKKSAKLLTGDELFSSAIWALDALAKLTKKEGYSTEAFKITRAMDCLEDVWESDLSDAQWESKLHTKTLCEVTEDSKKESPATTQTNTQHYAIVQRSADTVLVVGESAEDAVREYCIEHEEATKAELLGSWHSDQDVVLVPCSEFLYEKALAGDDIIYFWDEGILNSYITEVEDFDRADTSLSSEYNESCHSTAFDSYSEPAFNLKEYLLEVAQNYDSLLDYDVVSSIHLDIEEHFSDDYSRDYDTVVFALCTNSNQYSDGQFRLDGEDVFCLSFDHSDAVLILRKS